MVYLRRGRDCQFVNVSGQCVHPHVVSSLPETHNVAVIILFNRWDIRRRLRNSFNSPVTGLWIAKCLTGSKNLSEVILTSLPKHFRVNSKQYLKKFQFLWLSEKNISVFIDIIE